MVGKGQDSNAFAGQDIFGNADSILIKQEIALLESVCGIEAKNRYRIHINGQPQLYAMETSECCERICCAPCRTLTMNIYNGQDQHAPIVLSMEKKFHCPVVPCPLILLSWGFTIPCCIGSFQCPAKFTVKEGGKTIGEVFDPPGPGFFCKMDLVISDANGGEIFKVGPKTLCSFGQICPCLSGEYIKVTQGGAQVAAIERKTLDLMECCCKVNRFEVTFDKVKDPTHRKLLLAAAFLLDLQYWEQQQKN